MRISMSAGHSARLHPVRHKTSFLRHEWRTNIAAQKVPEATHTSCFAMNFMSFVYSASLSLVRRQTSISRYEWYEDSTLLSTSEEQSGSWRAVWQEACFPCHEWGKHLTLLKVPERTHTSCFTMMLMSPLHSETLNLVRRRTNILRYDWHEDYAFHKIPERTHSLCFYDDI